MQLSSNYGLKLMEGTDNVKRQDFVDNFTKIDSEMKAINDNGYPSLTATGTNAYVGSTDRIKSLGKGTKLTLFVGTDSTGNCSLNLNTYGAKNIKDSFGNIVTNLKANIPYNLCYNGTDFILQGKGGGGDATAVQLLLGKKATVDNGQIVGTLDLSNLVTGNIKNGVTINGVTGKSTVVDTSDAVLDSQYLLTGYSGYDDGVKKTGAMVNHTFAAYGTYTPVSSVKADGGGSLVFAPPNGYYTNEVNAAGFGELIATDANYIASNIISGKSIFGLAGSATVESLGGKKFASGSVNRSQGWGSFTINGLGFVPRIVIVIEATHCWICMREISTTNFYYFNYGNGSYTTGNLTSDGFTSPCYESAITWQAFE